METKHNPQMLLIAGTGRNTGKTTLACTILRKFSSHLSIIAVKITPHFHKMVESGKVIMNEGSIFIAEETDGNTGKDSSLMLQAGAVKSYFVMVKDEHLEKAFQKIEKLIPADSLLVCESGGLRQHVVPGLFFMMNKPYGELIKPEAEKLMLLVDRVITFDGERIDFEIDRIEISNNQWKLNR